MELLVLVLLIVAAVLFALRGFGLAAHPRLELVALGLCAWVVAEILGRV